MTWQEFHDAFTELGYGYNVAKGLADMAVVLTTANYSSADRDIIDLICETPLCATYLSLLGCKLNTIPERNKRRV